MARTLDAILAELAAHDAPQEELVRRRQSAIPGAIEAEEQGLRAQEQDYYDTTIMGDARRRGIGFGGIPLGERARYGATQFLPALARNRAAGREKALDLEGALLELASRRRQQGQGIYEAERNFGEQQRQFNESMGFQREQAAAAQRRAAAEAGVNNAWMSALNRPQAAAQQAQPQAAPPKTNAVQQQAFDFVDAMRDKGAMAILNDFNAAKRWYEKTGDMKDYYKLNFYKQLYPDILGKATFNQQAGMRF